jgi:DNA-binding GntR family transcriptional regulator
MGVWTTSVFGLPIPPECSRKGDDCTMSPVKLLKARASAESMAGGKSYEIIKDAILSGAFCSGQRLKENDLTTLCKVSRTPVREALRRLASEGLVVMIPNVGAQVSSVAPVELEEIYVLRGMIESHAAARAATRLTTEALASLRALAVQMERIVASGLTKINEDFQQANSEFHHIILDAAMSPRLSSMAALVIEIPLTLRTFSLYSAQERMRSLQHHRELIEAFEARDSVWAASVMKSHVRAAFQALVRAESPKGGVHSR